MSWQIALGALSMLGLFWPTGKLEAAEQPVLSISRGPRDLGLPPGSTRDAPRGYGLGCPIQLGPTTAGLFCNLRSINPKPQSPGDWEDGTDVFVFDDLANVGRQEPMALMRNEPDPEPADGQPRLIVKFPAAAGFWPLGAKRADGSDHPGNGKGFAFCQALSLVRQEGDAAPFTWAKPFLRCLEVVQLSFDGQSVSVVRRELMREPLWAVPDGWNIITNGLGAAIPDGDDLLVAVLARHTDGNAAAGVCRFRYADAEWRPIYFTPAATGSEPSLARRRNGSLVFCTRDDDKSIALQESADDGKTWKQLVHVANVRSDSPVTVHAAPDGTVFVASSPKTAYREQLAVWQLKEGAAELMPAVVIRDCLADFPPLPKETVRLQSGTELPAYLWHVDHPISATLRLADGRWHGVLAYRIMAYPSLKPELFLPQTGCYLEEITSTGPAMPPWRF